MKRNENTSVRDLYVEFDKITHLQDTSYEYPYRLVSYEEPKD